MLGARIYSAVAEDPPSASDEEQDVAEAPEADDDSAWLCCDKCSAWVLAIADGIVDVAPYDEKLTPNPLPYVCPACRNASKGALCKLCSGCGGDECVAV